MNKFFESSESNDNSQPTEKRIIITVPVGDSYTAEEIEAIIKEAVAGYQGVKVELK